MEKSKGNKKTAAIPPASPPEPDRMKVFNAVIILIAILSALIVFVFFQVNLSRARDTLSGVYDRSLKGISGFLHYQTTEETLSTDSTPDTTHRGTTSAQKPPGYKHPVIHRPQENPSGQSQKPLWMEEIQSPSPSPSPEEEKIIIE